MKKENKENIPGLETCVSSSSSSLSLSSCCCCCYFCRRSLLEFQWWCGWCPSPLSLSWFDYGMMAFIVVVLVKEKNLDNNHKNSLIKNKENKEIYLKVWPIVVVCCWRHRPSSSSSAIVVGDAAIKNVSFLIWWSCDHLASEATNRLGAALLKSMTWSVRSPQGYISTHKTTTFPRARPTALSYSYVI